MSNRSGTVKKDEIFVTHCGSMEPSVLDFQERDIGHLAGREAKIQFVHSPDFANCHFANGSTDTFGSDTEHPGKPHTSDQHCDEERGMACSIMLMCLIRRSLGRIFIMVKGKEWQF
ncbi:hypothetical protein LOK49_LG04G01217 [Camellia lanceoleosa]|uniref:Uncharacterized protein n=1 Tax=Camellia lanceoleosa TaxID=1840588 RepID=A0ACC0I315_9ERIC|nr:hypothetical protein LOK49_LG04G01217 [Camellia lanceoleosa]